MAMLKFLQQRRSSSHKKGFTLIELLVVIGVLAVLLTITLIAINPAHQFAQANDTKRRSDINAVLNAVHQFSAENKGVLPTGIGAVETEISTAGVNLCGQLVPTYIPAFPVDPQVKYTTTAANGDPIPAADCGVAGGYVTGYRIVIDATNRVTVSATGEVNPAVPLTVTR